MVNCNESKVVDSLKALSVASRRRCWTQLVIFIPASPRQYRCCNLRWRRPKEKTQDPLGMPIVQRLAAAGHRSCRTSHNKMNMGLYRPALGHHQKAGATVASAAASRNEVW